MLDPVATLRLSLLGFGGRIHQLLLPSLLILFVGHHSEDRELGQDGPGRLSSLPVGPLRAFARALGVQARSWRVD